MKWLSKALFDTKTYYKYQGYIEYTDGTVESVVVPGEDWRDAFAEFNWRRRHGVYDMYRRPDGFFEFKPIRAYKLDEHKI